MKVIDVPKPFVPDPETAPDKEITFAEFLNGALAQYKPFGTWEKMDRVVIIKKAIKEMDGHLRLEDADYDDVVSACKTAAFNVNLVEDLIVYKKALLNAQNVPTPTKT